MTINYSDGRAVEAVLLTRTESTLLAAMQGADDVMEISNINGTWVSADCEPVAIEFAWQRLDRKPKISEVDCQCSTELAARLIRLLFTDSNAELSRTYSPDRKYLSALRSARRARSRRSRTLPILPHNAFRLRTLMDWPGPAACRQIPDCYV